MTKVNAPLKLDGARNFRDLGNYPTESGGAVKSGMIFRADGLYELSEADCDLLYNMGIRLNIDLRSEREVRLNPSKLSAYKDIAYVHIPFPERVYHGLASGDMASGMGEIYLLLLKENGPELVTALRAVLDLPSGAAVFNCTAGKDRTGILSMLIFKILRVPERVIVDDYQVSKSNLDGKIEKKLKQGGEYSKPFPQFVFDSKPEDMELALKNLEKNHGGIEKYLDASGFTKTEIIQFRQKYLKVV